MQLLTSRLILREFTADDWTAVLAYQSEPLYLRYYPWQERTAADVQVLVQMFLGQQRAEPRLKYQFAVTLKTTGELIGNCGVRLDTAEAHQADIGYELAPAHWGHGYASEAARAVVQFGFTELHIHRIWAECVAENVGSARVLQKLGMKQEAQLRQNQYFKGRYWDTLIFGMLAQEIAQK
jgi:RimJ/RimL family protein N-acetyltransferase